VISTRSPISSGNRPSERLGTERPTHALAGELADLLYHSLVLCAERGIPPTLVIDALKRRHAR
jgi:phosphoribosyl-ATP pyrophosphohydrolase